jgi:hypothetical protein
MRTSSRYQFLGLMTTSAALLASGVGHSVIGSGQWILLSLAAVVFIVGLAYWWRLGRHLVIISIWLTQLEGRINLVVSGEQNISAPLSWESQHQRRDRWSRISLGPMAPHI